jgi:tetratricopeptide (TPR) repeat protein
MTGAALGESPPDCSAASEAASVRALLACGLACQSEGRFTDAGSCYEKALLLNPSHFDALHMLGVVAIQTGRFDRAGELITRALRQNPNVAAAHRNLALAHFKQVRLDNAVTSYRRAIALEPSFLDTYIHLAGVLNGLTRPQEALAMCERAIALRPDAPVAHLAKAVALRFLERPEDVLESCNTAIRLNPNYVEGWDKRGAALQDLRRPDDALQSCETAIALQADFAPAYAHAGLICLQMGQFERGWRLSEWRNKPGGTVAARNFPRPRWCGEESIEGMRLLVYSEQGLGDTIQFCRYAKLLVARGANVILSVPSSLCALLKGLGPTIQIIAESDPLPEFDRHCPLLSLPFALGTTEESIPTAIPYLFAEPQRVLHWQEKLGRAGFKIGISWQGSKLPVDIGRSFPLKMFHPISLIPGVRLISLQKGYGSEQLNDLPVDMTFETLGTDFDSGPDGFLDAAAVMDNIDLIITSDTSIAHLAGALGRPTWVALKQVPDWRWMLEREDSPWYPHHRLFRQKHRGDWEGVFETMRANLPMRGGMA